MRAMGFDPANPPIWLRKLHVSAAQISPTDYPATPREGILLCCRLSDAQRAWSKALHAALGLPSPSTPPPLDNPFRVMGVSESFDAGS